VTQLILQHAVQFTAAPTRGRVRMLARRLSSANDPYRDPVRADSSPSVCIAVLLPPLASRVWAPCGWENPFAAGKLYKSFYTACTVNNQWFYLPLCSCRETGSFAPLSLT